MFFPAVSFLKPYHFFILITYMPILMIGSTDVSGGGRSEWDVMLTAAGVKDFLWLFFCGYWQCRGGVESL